jgi:outer membrane immunogenic protein
MQRALSCAVLCLALATSGPAAARSPLPDWTGFRGGLVAGFTFGSHTDSHAGLPPGPTSNGDYSLSHGTSGWQAGFTGGYFWRQDYLVEGLEGDIQFGNSGGTQTITGVAHRDGSGASPSNFLSIRERTDTMIDLRGTLGIVATSRLLPFVTGGWFYEHGYYSGQFHDATPSNFILKDGAGRGGWTIGGGLACKLSRLWVLKAEYLYYDVGNHVAATKPIGGLQSQFTFGGTGGIARLALTVRFP